jgi:hypothetical protein
LHGKQVPGALFKLPSDQDGGRKQLEGNIMSSANWTTPSCAQDGTDLSEASSGFSRQEVPDVYQGQSMAGGNATTSKPDWTESGAGSFSEGTSLVMDTAQHTFGDNTDVDTALGSEAGKDDHRVTGNRFH